LRPFIVKNNIEKKTVKGDRGAARFFYHVIQTCLDNKASLHIWIFVMSKLLIPKLVIIGLGGFAGSILRYLVSEFFSRQFENPWFPHGTLAVNVIGCLLIGFVGGLAEIGQAVSPELRMLLIVGFLGGFTTFSTFGYELFAAGKDGQMMGAFINFGLHMGLGFSGLFLGFWLSRAI